MSKELFDEKYKGMIQFDIDWYHMIWCLLRFGEVNKHQYQFVGIFI